MGLLHVLSVSLLYVAIHKVVGDSVYERGEATIEARGSDLSFCYGKNSICSISNDLFDQCRRFDDNFDNLKPWYDCICGNGYVSTRESCKWCAQVYELTFSSYDITKDCERNDASIAPLPSSVLDIYSSWNATYTGIISGDAAKATNSPAITTGGLDGSNSGAQTNINSRSSTTPPSTTKPQTTKVTTGATVVQTFIGAGGDDLLPTGSPTVSPFNTGGSKVTTATATASAALKAGGNSPGAAAGLQAKLVIPGMVIMFASGIILMNLL